MSLLSPGQPADLEIADIAALKGLSSQEAALRQQRDGANELPAARRRSVRTIAVGIVTEPMFALLLAGGLVYLFLGNVEEAAVLLGSILVIMGIDFSQESRTERALEALRDLFGFSLLTPIDLLVCLGAGILSVLWFEVFKLLRRLAGKA